MKAALEALHLVATDLKPLIRMDAPARALL